MPTNAPILVLREVGGDHRTVPIYIGGPEAHAIDLAVSKTKTARPMTHDLMVLVIESMGGRIKDVRITQMVEGTYFADLTLIKPDGDELTISCRPSDAVALVARGDGIPILASEELVDEAGILDPEVEPGDEAMVEELRKFLEQVNPDDFR